VMEGFEFARAWDIKILATDISEKALSQARAGIYENNAEEKIPNSYMNKYVMPVNNKLVISQDIVKKVNFKKFNLHELNYGNYLPENLLNRSAKQNKININGFFDVIFCRNVMIYFDLSAQNKLINNLYDCLKPGGYLFTGDAECLNIHNHDFIPVENNGAYTYRKPINKRGQKNI
jgi:chemotaxis protein methyltransferase CheR